MISHPEHVVGYAVVYSVQSVYQTVVSVSDTPGEAVVDACGESSGLRGCILEDYTADEPDVRILGVRYSPLCALAAVDPLAYDALADEAVQWLIDWIQCDWQPADGRVCLHECASGSAWWLYPLTAAIRDDETEGLTDHTLMYLGYTRHDMPDGPAVWIRAAPGAGA